MNIKVSILSTVALLMIFFIVSILLMPVSPEHGYYTALAKYMSLGMIPYKDFYPMEMPIGIGLYALMFKFIGVESSTNFSNIPFILINVANMLLMMALFIRLKIKKMLAISGIFFYFLLCYSSDSLHLNMEVLAVTLLLGACLAVMKRRGFFTLLAAFLFSVAVGCKAQITVMFPVLILMATIKGKRNCIDFKQGGLLIALCVVFLFFGYIVIAYICGNHDWIENVTWEIEKAPHHTLFETKNILSYFLIQSVRCGMVFLPIAAFMYKKLHPYGRRMTIIAVVATVCYFSLFYFRIEVVQGMFLYPFVTIALMHIVQSVGRRVVATLLLFILTAPPAVLSAREFMKFGDGKLRDLQNEEMCYIKEILKKPGKAVMLIDNTDKEFYIGPQIFSECPHVKPVYIGRGSLGYNNGYYESENFIANINDANYIIINDAAFTGITIGKHVDIFGEKIEKMRSSGTQSIMIYEE